MNTQNTNEGLTITWQDALDQIREITTGKPVGCQIFTFGETDMQTSYLKISFGWKSRTIFFKDSIASLLLKADVEAVKNEFRRYSER